MRIRNLLVAGIVLAFLLVATRLVLLEIGDREAARLDQFQLQVERISRDSATLLILSQDYMMHGSARADRQWHDVHASVIRTLPLASRYSSDLQAGLDALRDTAQGLPDLFDALKRATNDPDRVSALPRQEMLAEHLLTETGRISDGAFELAEQLIDLRSARELRERRVTLATMAVFAMLVSAIGAVVWRRVLRPMAEMDSAARAIERGDLAVRSNYRANDEFGRLSSNFDAMTRSLQERTASAIREVADRRQAEEDLQQSNERFEIATGAARIGVWQFDVASNTLRANDLLYGLFGRTRLADAEPIQRWLECIHPEDVERVKIDISERIDGERPFDTEFRVRRPDGEIRHMRATGQVARRADGIPPRLTGVTQDITDAKRAELILHETSSLLHGVLESASEVSIIATDPDFTITVFNAGAERLLGYASEELVARATPMPIHDADEVKRRGIELSQALGRPVDGAAVFTEPTTLRQPREWTYVRKDGSRVAVSLVVTAMRRDNGELFGYLGIAHDVTRQKEYEESLRLAMHKATQASRAKSQFLANMSHEIRTPMNAVIGLAYLFGQTRLDRQQAGYLGKLKIASSSLLMLINDVLDLSKIEAGEVMVEHAPFGLHALLKSLGDVMVEQAHAKRIAFEIDIADDLPRALLGDAMRLGQVLTNLVSNAIKFTDTGGVRLRVGQTAATAEATTLQFSVRDSGIGMTPETLSRLFKPFAQADSSTTRRFGGTGLGLSIVERLTALMGGTVAVTSSPGVGSEFCVELTLPVAPPEALVSLSAASPAPDQRGLRGLRVLIADDSEINLDVAQRILELEGAQVTLARNGQEAFELMQAGPQAFDVVLMDVQMPVLDGYKATRRIRSELGLSVPIIALTAGALTSERRRAIDAGMNDFITKPFDPRELVRTLRQHGRPPPVGAPAPSDALPASPVSSGAAWPEIDGIDSADVSQRLCGDSALFRSMLKRLFKEFDDVSIAPADAAPVAQHASRMHKLKGSAGMLGATVVHRLAGDAETACRAGDADLAAGHAVQLTEQLRRLKASCAAFLAEAVAPAHPLPSASEGGVEPQAVEQLIELLRKQNLSATTQFVALAPDLANLTGARGYELLCDHMENLQFGAAAELLAEACRHRREIGA